MTPITATDYYTMLLGDRTEREVVADARAAGVSIQDYLVEAHAAAVRVGMIETDECDAWLDALDARIRAALA